MDKTDYKIFKKRWILEGIKGDYLSEITQNTDYKGSHSEKSRMIKYLSKIEDNTFEDLLSEYRDAGNSSNYLFFLEEEVMKSYKNKVQDIIDKLPREPKISDVDPLFIESYIWKNEVNELWMRFYHLKPKKINCYWNFVTNKEDFTQGFEVIQIPVRINFEKNYISIRESKIKSQKEILELILDEFLPKSKRLVFDKENLDKLVKYMTILRSAHVQYEDENLQNASYTAGTADDDGLINLLDSEKFKKESATGTILTCRFSIPLVEKADPSTLKSNEVISMGVNLKEGKIYFITKLKETETRKWIHDILDNLDIERILHTKL